jgi:beta-xylosidase
MHFTYTSVLGGYEPGVTRRDPSPVIRVGDAYYVWYSRSLADPSGYAASVWYATSKDGWAWQEAGEALSKGPADAWDAHGVFTPTILVAAGRYYLFYTAVPAPFDNDGGGPAGTPTAIGVAVSDSPDGPWSRWRANPVLRPGPAGAFDGHRVDDACFVVREGRYWMYYKGRGRGLTPAQTKMGLARADAPTGPYEKCDVNPVLGSGHEVCVWPHDGGVAALVAPVGPDGATVQISRDGIHFERRASVTPPSAPGPYRRDHFVDGYAGSGITWGLCHNHTAPRPFLMRFDA